MLEIGVPIMSKMALHSISCQVVWGFQTVLMDFYGHILTFMSIFLTGIKFYGKRDKNKNKKKCNYVGDW